MSEDVSNAAAASGSPAAASGSPAAAGDVRLLEGKTTFSSADVYVYDDGNGGLITEKGVRVVGAQVNYDDGSISIPKAPFKDKIHQDSYGEFSLAHGAPPYVATVGELRVITDVDVIAPPRAMASWVGSPETRTINETADNGLWTFDVLAEVPYPRAALTGSWRFDVAGAVVLEREGVLYKDWDYLTGTGTAVGTFDPLSGRVSVRVEGGRVPEIKVLAGLYVTGEYEVKQFYGHTAAAPIRPNSLTVYADLGNKTLVGNSQADGRISGGLTGKIDYETGFYRIEAEQPLPPELVRYNAVSQSHIPLDGSLLGIDPTRLPADGRVAVYRAGDYVVVGNRLQHPLGSAHSAGQTVKLPRQDNDRICVVDSDGKHIAAEKYDVDLASGTLTWGRPLDLSDYRLPLFAVCVWEEDNRIHQTDISGSLKLQKPISRDYPQENTYVSSAVLGGDLQTRVSEPFAQAAWLQRWQDAAEGEPVLSRLNTKDYPFSLTADGAITERWLIKFRDDTQFDLYGEQLGLVARGDRVSDLAPVNPATGKPYFSLPSLAFGGGWEADNCIRFNTYGTILPIWLLRVVQPSADKTRGRDGVSLCLRGNTEVLNDR